MIQGAVKARFVFDGVQQGLRFVSLGIEIGAHRCFKFVGAFGVEPVACIRDFGEFCGGEEGLYEGAVFGKDILAVAAAEEEAGVGE